MGKFIRDLGWILGLVFVCGFIGWIVSVLWPLKMVSDVSSDLSQNFRRIDLAEFKEFVQTKKAIVFDARAKGFYQLGHVPGAKNLSREKFEKDFEALTQINLSERRIVVYCSGMDCEDSMIVAKKLVHLGVTNIFIFEGGWEEWEAAGLLGEIDE